MSIISAIKGWFQMNFFNRAKEEFHIKSITSSQMDSWINECANIYRGEPCWLDPNDHIDTVDFAKAICSEVARLTTLGIGIHVDGSSRADWLQKQIDKIYYQLRHWVEYGCAYGTAILKPNGNTVDLYVPGQFVVTEAVNGEIRGVVFYTTESDATGDRWYTRMEYHHFVDGLYHIENRCFIGYSKGEISRPIDISLTPWKDLAASVAIQNVGKPLFGVFRTPQANNIDVNSPMGLPVFSEAVQELRDLDIAYSRNSKEIRDSKRTVLLDSNTMLPVGSNTQITAYSLELQCNAMGLPDMVRNVQGDGVERFYQEINPQLNTETRTVGIKGLLNQIGYKVGFSNGHFVFNESTGIQTATQVEADQQRTIQFIKDIRDKLENCLTDLLYALNAFADLYKLAPAGQYETVFDFGDITYNREEDRARYYSLMISGKFPLWRYLVKFEGFTEAEAREIEKETQPKYTTLFSGDAE